MDIRRETSCCFTGHRPDKLPWGFDESDPRCAALKASIARELARLYRLGYRHFISGMAQGCDLYFTEAALTLREKCPDVSVEGAIPCPTQADHWPEPDRRRWRAILDACDLETVVQQEYGKFCMLRRDRYLVDRSSAILGVFDGTTGGTQYTLAYAVGKEKAIWLLDPANPGAEAVRLEL